MKSFENIDVKSVGQAVSLLQKFHQEKKPALVVGGGSEALQLMKDNVLTPDYVVNLKTIPGLDQIKEERGGFRIGALAKLSDIEEHPAIRGEIAQFHHGQVVVHRDFFRLGSSSNNICGSTTFAPIAETRPSRARTSS